MFLNKASEIPGISDNGEFVKWIETSDIKFHENLSVEESPLGGAGLFFDGNEPHEDPLEVLRIPRKSTFDYMNLLEVLEQLKANEECVTDIDSKESTILVKILEVMEPQNESEILYCYFWGFFICHSLREINKNQSILNQYKPYLKLLTNTEVMNFPSNIDTSVDPFVKKLVERASTMEKKYARLQESFSDINISQLIPFETFYQIYQGIKSRVLEIPHEAEDKDDFYVNVTLVPTLDFANHSHNNNAFFDVDNNTGDILLKVDSNRPAGKFEVTISYSPIESIQHFIETYGFIPKQLGFQLIELKFPELNPKLQSTKHDLICKWLRIVPQIQIVSNYDENVYLNFFNNNLPLLFIPGLQYNKDWRKSAIESFNTTNQVELPQEIHETILSFLSYQESDCDVINGVAPIGVKYHDKPVQLQNLLQESGHDSDESFDLLVSSATDFIVDYSKHVLDTQLSVDVVDNFTFVVSRYLAYKSRILQLLIARAAADESLILPLDVAQPEWETSYRSPPKHIDVDDLFS